MRSRTQRLIGRLIGVDQPASAPRRHELRLGVVALVLLVGLGGWMVARVQDHGLRVALNRADGRLGGHLPTDARLYRPTSIDTLAAGRWRPTRARVYGQITYANREPDGDIHIVLKAPDGAFVVLEIIPELPIPAPHDDDRITAWGIVRHDGLHNWWELHPLIEKRSGLLRAVDRGRSLGHHNAFHSDRPQQLAARVGAGEGRIEGDADAPNRAGAQAAAFAPTSLQQQG